MIYWVIDVKLDVILDVPIDILPDVILDVIPAVNPDVNPDVSIDVPPDVIFDVTLNILHLSKFVLLQYLYYRQCANKLSKKFFCECIYGKYSQHSS